MFCRKRNITRNTSATASNSVTATWRIEMSMKRELSYGIAHCTPLGKKRESSSMRVRTAFAVASALPVGESCTPMPVDGLPFSRADVA